MLSLHATYCSYRNQGKTPSDPAFGMSRDSILWRGRL